MAKKSLLPPITARLGRRALSQDDTIPWLRELEPQSVLMNGEGAAIRGITTGDMVRVFNNSSFLV